MFEVALQITTRSLCQIVLGDPIAACVLGAQGDGFHHAAAIARISAEECFRPMGKENLRGVRHVLWSLVGVLHLEYGALRYLSGIAFTLICNADDDS
jgi:hypothetical protein